MNKKIGRKKIGGIIRRTKNKRTSTTSRSFENVKISKLQPIQRKKSQLGKKRTKNINTKTRKPITPILGDFSREKIPEIELKKTFYTPPQQSKNSRSTTETFFRFLKQNKTIVGHFLRIVFVVLLLVLFFNARGATTVELKPHLQIQEINELITVLKNPNESQLGFDIIAVTDKLSLSVIAGETKSVEQRAGGEITIFNNFSSEPQRLLPETRFESAGGQVFLLDGGEIIIPGKNEDGPGKIDATVIATEPGEQYNIGVTDFSLPGYQELGLDDKYNNIYAVSKSSFAGGFIGTRSVIGENQLLQNQKILQQKLNDRLLLRLEKEKTDQVILIEDTTTINYQEPKIIYSDDQETAVITIRGTIISGIISDNKLGDYLDLNIINVESGKPAQVLSTNGLEIVNNSFIDISDVGLTQIDISIIGEVLLESQIDQQKIISDISNIKKNNLISYFENIDTVDIAQINVRPFWRSKTHTLIDEISIVKNRLD